MWPGRSWRLMLCVLYVCVLYMWQFVLCMSESAGGNFSSSRPWKLLHLGRSMGWHPLHKTHFIVQRCLYSFQANALVKRCNSQRDSRGYAGPGGAVDEVFCWHCSRKKRLQPCWEILLGLHREVQLWFFFFFIHVVNDMLVLSLLIMHFFSSSLWKECFRFDSSVMPWQDLSQLPAVAFVDTFWSCYVLIQLPS